jgi:DNA-binding PadR family transcriptional regulator
MHHRHRDEREERGGCGERRFARGEFGFGDRFGRHGRGRQGLRGGRVFDQGDLRYVLLHLISEKPRHGYELIKAIEEKFGGTYSPSPGVIYPTLTLLEELGYIAPDTGGEAGGTKKLFAITAEGTAFLDANRPQLDGILARMAQVASAYAGGPAPEIQRAAQNLRFALAIRLRRGPLNAEQIRTVTAALDRAAGEIEQS